MSAFAIRGYLLTGRTIRPSRGWVEVSGGTVSLAAAHRFLVWLSFGLRVRAWMAKDRPGPKPTSDMADIIDLMLATGARIGEVLALRWNDIDLDAPRPNLPINGTIKTEASKGTYRKATPKSDAGVRTVVLPDFAVQALLRRRESARSSSLDAVFPTRKGTW